MHNVFLNADTQTLMHAYLYITSQNDNFKLLSEIPPWRGKKQQNQTQHQHHTFSYKFMPLNYDVK